MPKWNPFRFRSIQAKIFLGLMAVTVVSISLVMVYMYQKSEQTIRRSAVQFATDGLQHSDEKLSYLIHDLERILTVLALDQDYVAAGVTSVNAFPSLEWFQEKKRVEAFLKSLRGYNTYIDRIGVVGLKNRMLFQSGQIAGLDPADDEWSRRLLRTEPNRGRLYAEYRNGKVSAGKIVFVGGQAAGYAVVDLNPGILQSTFYSQPAENVQLFVVSSDGTFVHHHDEEMIGRSIRGTLYRPLWERLQSGKPAEYEQAEIDGNTYLHLTRHVPELDWTIMAVISETEMMRGAVIVRNEMIRLLLVVILLVFGVSVLVSKQITRNLKVLLQAMESVKRGNLDARPALIANDEAGQLSVTFTMMMRRIRNLMNDVEERERLRREADFKALQSQIHPHFVYNTLNTIRYLANIQKTPNIEELTSSFITLLRAITDHQEEWITVKEELELVRHYLKIQQYRYAGRLAFQLSAEPECESRRILKFTLQPLVENAVQHGIGAKEEGGLVSVDVFPEQGDLVCVVHDNGVGMTGEQIGRALSGAAGPGASGMRVGVGMRNVDQRIKLYFGDRYGLTLFSEPGQSTTVEVRLPGGAARTEAHGGDAE